MVSSSQQLHALIWMIATGFLVGFIFDLYRIFRGLVRPCWFLTAAGDLIFWLIVATFTYGVLLWVNFGEVRFFIFLGIIFGLFIYYKVCSAIIIKLIYKLIYFIESMLTFLRRLLVIVIIRPVTILAGVVFWPLGKVVGACRHFFRKLHKYLLRIKVSCNNKIIRGKRKLYRLLKSKFLFFFRKK
ncbi:MAG: spore cortex biosynthesis protein YabQ [bacterium]